MARRRAAIIAGFASPCPPKVLYRRFAYSLALLFALILLGSLGYGWLEGWSFADGLYMTVITVGTVGYGETNPLSAAGRVYTIALILVSTGVMVYVTSSLTALILEGELTELFKKRKMNKRIENLSGHYLVCGDSSIGQHIVEELGRTHQSFIVIDWDAAKVNALMARDILAIQGDATADTTLIEAGIARAAGLVTCLHTDADNLFVVLTARRLNPDLRIIAKAIDATTREKLMQVGADGVVMPEAIGGLRMASELLRPHVVNFLDRMLRDKDRSIRVDEIRIDRDAWAIGKTLRDTGLLTASGVSLVAIADGDGAYRFNPAHDTRLDQGDVLILLGDTQVMAGLRQRLAG